MEKKTTQRIIGVFVLVALAIIVLPLFLSKNNETSSDLASSTSASAPATSDQSKPSVTISSNETTQSDPQLLNKISPTPALVQNPNDTKQAGPANDSNKNDEHPASNQVSLNDTLQTGNNSANANEKNEPNKTDSFDLSSKEQLNKQATDKNASSKILPKHQTKVERHHATKAKQTAWVVQMGNFKNKENARRLTDRLKTAGFKAFSHVVGSGSKERVRVYVGPENKQASASQLSNKINSKTKLRGIVVSYKPIAL